MIFTFRYNLKLPFNYTSKNINSLNEKRNSSLIFHKLCLFHEEEKLETINYERELFFIDFLLYLDAKG